MRTLTLTLTATLTLTLAACGAPSAAPDAGAPDAAPDAGDGRLHTPVLVHGDTTDGPVTYTLAVDATATHRLGLDDRAGDAVDDDLEIGATHANMAIETELPGGDVEIVVDAYQGMSGPFTLSILHADPGDCLTNPLPQCQDGDAPDPNGAITEPPGLGGCPAGMTLVDTFCIDRWEAALQGHSPYANPGSGSYVAVSAPGVVPQGYINQTQAGAACAAAGKRLCTDTEWLRACKGAAGHTFPYGDTRVAGACNDSRACHPAVQYFESTDSSVFSMIDNSCIGQLPDGLARTGSYASCASDDGVWDLMGNLHEWTADPAGTFRGGFYVDTQINGAGCNYVTTAHDVSHWDYSTGFRCCADP